MELYKWIDHRDQAVMLMANLVNARLIFMTNGEEAVLLYETEGGPGLQDAEPYEVLDAKGDVNHGFYAVFNNIPVSEEGRELFESRFKNRAGKVEHELGFAAIRVLRPVSSDTYVILTLWKDEESFKAWQQSQAYSHAHAKRGTEEGIDKRPNIFPRPSFVTTYIR